MRYLLSIDQGTTSTRALVCNEAGEVVSIAWREHRQIMPKAGFVEHDANEIWNNTLVVVAQALREASLSASDIAGIGITNQRETTVIWDRTTGEPIAPALVWQDTRTQDIIDRLKAGGLEEEIRQRTGLPLATYFSASKIVWLLNTVPSARERAERGELAFGTTDSWLVWKLTGGVGGGVHVTDVTNASRTLLMNLETLQWDPWLLDTFQIPRTLLPKIRSSSEVYGHAASITGLGGVPIAGILGDQQAATFGQAAIHAGQSKNTYGTGNFLLVNTGTDIVRSDNGLITTVAYQLSGQPAHYALEGSIAVTGSLIQWLRDNLGIIGDSSEVEALAASVPDNGGCYFVPAFSGLFAPYWRSDARGVVVGLTRFITRAHLARAALEATAFQTREVVDVINDERGTPLNELRVDGGMTSNALLMQFQADLLGIPVVRPRVTETTAMGAAYAAGLAVGVWSGVEQVEALWREDTRYEPHMEDRERHERLRMWKKAVERTFDWVD
jgi:glycerol kinase